jgi:hypothetical protein
MYYRWDYLKLMFECEADLFHTYLGELEKLAEERIGNRLWRQGCRVKALGETEAGKRRYVIVVQGSAANIATHLPFRWWPHVRRLDVKATDLPYTDDEVHNLRVCLLKKPNPYNIVAMNSKDRVKNDKRDAGGRGFSIGSHKSDLRVAMYRRGKEGVGLEFQCKDEMLRRLLNRHAGAFPPQEHPSTFWLTLKDDIIAAGEQRFARSFQAAGLDYRRALAEEPARHSHEEMIDKSDPRTHTQGRFDLDALEEYTASTDF